MEANSLIHKPKRQKLNEEQGIDGNIKCFGNLPDVILRHILSFLHIKNAVRTSVLSKRWEFLWTSIPYLIFSKALPAKRTLFMNFVERAFCLRDSDIIGFHLDCDVQCDAYRVKSWISAAVRRNAQALWINLSNLRGQFSLPHCVFSSETLESLILDMPCILKVPPISCFSNLKILHIKNVAFSDEYTTQQLFSGLPVLQTLKLEKCRWDPWGCVKVLSISAPKLHSLTINEAYMENLFDGDGCQIMIFGASLEIFSYTGEFFNEYLLYNSSSLEVAAIGDTGGSEEWETDEKGRQLGYRMFNVLMGLPNVKSLRLFGSAVEDLTYVVELLPNMPIFNNLTYLEFGPVNIDGAALLKILQNSPCLETLTFVEEIDLLSDCEKDDIIWDPVPSCFLSHLKCIKVGCYDGNKDLYAVKMLLKNAVVLDEMVIVFKKHVAENLEMQENLYKQLMELPKGSQNCKIVLKDEC